MLVLVEECHPSVQCCELSVLTGLGAGAGSCVAGAVSEGQCLNEVLRKLLCLHLSACLFQAYLQQAQELVILETIMLQTLGMSF